MPLEYPAFYPKDSMSNVASKSISKCLKRPIHISLHGQHKSISCLQLQIWRSGKINRELLRTSTACREPIADGDTTFTCGE